MNEELKRQNELADALIHKLERIKTLWEELPTLDDLEELANTAKCVAGCLEKARETYMDGDFPTLDDLQEHTKATAAMADALDAAMAAVEGGVR
jgi:hypothetical protein